MSPGGAYFKSFETDFLSPSFERIKLEKMLIRFKRIQLIFRFFFQKRTFFQPWMMNKNESKVARFACEHIFVVPEYLELWLLFKIQGEVSVRQNLLN